MIEAVSHSIWTPVSEGYNVSSVRSHFGTVRVQICNPDLQLVPTLVHATHVSWWDGHVGLVVARSLGLEFRVMMLEAELKKYGFLRYSGAFGFTPGSASSVRDALRYAGGLLHPGVVKPCFVLMFPAGQILPASRRPIAYRSGVASMALQAVQKFGSVHLRAAAFRFEHRGQAKPDAFVRLGAARVVTSGTVSDLTALLRADLTLEADALEADLRCDQLGLYRQILRGQRSAQEAWDVLRMQASGMKRL